MAVSILLPLASAALLLLPFTAVADATGCCREPDRAGDESARTEFLDHVHRYIELHRTLAAPLGPEGLCSDPEELQRGTDALATAIRDARAAARPGDIFTPRAAALLRRTIADVVREIGYDVPAPLDEMDEEGLPVVTWVEVNGLFPWRAGNTMPPMMLRRLPGLPGELEYRVVGRDLVLLDVRTNLVVDVLENALPAREQPCDVHPDMPVCWM